MFNLYEKYYLKNNNQSFGLLIIYSGMVDSVEQVEKLDNYQNLKRIIRLKNTYHLVSNFNFIK